MLSLVLNELATNALKYGTLSNETSHVELVWRIAQAGWTYPASGAPLA
ncbi:MAG: hypothetical protein R3D52_04820 [Xanthobacteraceae bacterium]